MKKFQSVLRQGKRLAAVSVSAVLLATGLMITPVPAKAATRSVYRVDSYGELTDYKGSAAVTIRANTSAISDNAFNGVRTTGFSVAGGNPSYKAVNGVLYNKAGTLLVRYPTQRSGAYTIPSGVTKIAKNAFKDCRNLTAVSMPSSVRSVGANAFSGCKRLSSATLSGNIKTIPSNAFANCEALRSAAIPAKVEKISDSAFYKCKALTSVRFPKKLYRIGEEAFYGCGIKKLVIPNTVTEIDEGAFKNCESLTSVRYSKNVSEIPAQVFMNCSALTGITNIGGVEEIYSAAFAGCERLADITFSRKLRSIGAEAFLQCASLGKVKISAVVSYIGSQAFCGAASSFEVAAKNRFFSSKKGVLLEKKGDILIQVPGSLGGTLTIPDSVTTVRINALVCSHIEKVEFPDSVTRLSKRHFCNMPKLKTIVLPKTLKRLDDQYLTSDMLSSDQIASIQIGKNNEQYASQDGVLYSADCKKIIFYPIGKKGSIKLPDALRKLNGQMKDNKLSNIIVSKENTRFTSVNGVLYDGPVKKMVCYPLKKAECFLPKSVKNIRYLDEVKTIAGIKSVKVSNKNKQYYAKDGVLFSKSDDVVYYYPPEKSGAYTIPANADYVADDAFAYARGLTRLTMGSKLKRTSNAVYLFTGCTKLSEVTVKQGELNYIRMDFKGCKNLKKVSLPSSVMGMNITSLPEKVTICGWENTGARELAQRNKGQFVSLGTIPPKVTGIRVRKIIDKYQITWNASRNVSGYQIYTSSETIANISGSNNTRYMISDINNYGNIYIRAYIIRNHKKIYGKAARY